MHSRKFGKMAALGLVLAVASSIGAFTTARAACTFRTYFAIAGVEKPVIEPGVGGDLVATCLHDAFGNAVPGQTVDFSVKLPDGSTTVVSGAPLTDATGSTSIAFTSTSQYGTYGITATSGPVVKANGSVIAAADDPKSPPNFSITQVTPIPPAHGKAGMDLVVSASGIVDSAGNPVNNGTVVTVKALGPSAITHTYTATVSGIVDTSSTASVNVTIPGNDLVKAGTWTIKATAASAQGAPDPTPNVHSTATGTDLSVIVDTGLCETLAVGVPANVTVGTNYTVTASNALDKFGNIVSGEEVTWAVTDALTNVTDPATTTPAAPILLAAGAASAQISAAAPDVAYGQYSIHSSCDGKNSANKTFQVQPGLANAFSGVAFSDTSPQPAGVPLTLNVGSVLFNTYAAKNGTTVKLHRTAAPSGAAAWFDLLQQVGQNGNPVVTKGDDPASVSFALPAEFQEKAGTYTYQLTADSASMTITMVINPGSPVADLGATIPDVNRYSDGTATVTNTPSITDTITLHVTRPDASTFDVITTTSDDPATITIPAAQLTKLGSYAVQVKAKDINGVIIGVGTTSFLVSNAVPDTIAVTPDSAVIAPLQAENITAIATVTVGGSPQPVDGRQLHFTVKDTLGRTVLSGYKTTDANGAISFSVFSTQTLVPGPYTVVVDDPRGTASGTATFTV